VDKTEANKKLVQNFVEDILVNGKTEKLAGTSTATTTFSTTR